MSITSYGSSPRLLLAPQFLSVGPLAPGSVSRLLLPVRNEHHDAVTNLRVQFFGEGVTLDPDELVIPRIERGEQKDVLTNVTVLPNIENRNLVRVWAQVTPPNGPPQDTAIATAPISMRTGIALADDGDAVILTNKGDDAISVVLQADGPISADVDFSIATLQSETLDLGPAESRRIAIYDYNGRLNARASNGERAIIYRRGAETEHALLEARLEISTPDEGARHDEVCPFMLTIRNAGTASARSVRLDLRVPNGVEIKTDLLTIDDSRVLTADRSFTDHVFTLKFGRLAPGATTVTRGGFTVSAETLTDDPNITLDGTIHAANLQPTLVQSGIVVDRAPVFMPNSTFIGDHIENADGTIDVDVTITHPEPRAIQHAYLQLELDGARLDAVYNGEFGSPLPVQPSTVGNRRVINIKLGRIEPDHRITPRVHLIPTPSTTSEHEIRMRAILNADAHNVDLGTRTYAIAGRADLSKSHLDKRDMSALRLNMPTTIHLMLNNTGTIPARDVRVSFQAPDNVKLNMPMPADGRWYPLASSIPPGGSAGMPIVIDLIAPPIDDTLKISASVDAENAPEITLEHITLLTPSSPHLRASTPITACAQQGLLNVATRITNEGDGIARNVALSVPQDDHPMPRMTAIDSAFIEETTHISALIEGIELGDLPPGTFRDVSWMVSPPATTYRATVRVSSETDEEPIVLSSLPTNAHIRPTLASMLPTARPLDETPTTAPVPPASPRANILDHAPGLNTSDAKALPASTQPRPEPPQPYAAYQAPEPNIAIPQRPGDDAGDDRHELAAPAPPQLTTGEQQNSDREPEPLAPPTLAAIQAHFNEADREEPPDLHVFTTGDAVGTDQPGADAAAAASGAGAGANAGDVSPNAAQHGAEGSETQTDISVKPLGANDAGNDLFGRPTQSPELPPIGSTTSAAAPPAPPPAPVLTGAMSQRLVDFVGDLNELQKLNGWRHLILVRVLADPSTRPLADIADSIGQSMLPAIMGRTYEYPSAGFISALTAYDEPLRNALGKSGHPVQGDNAGALDAALANAMPAELVLDSPPSEELHERLRTAYRTYVGRIRSVVGSEQNAARSKPDRDQFFTSSSVGSCDSALADMAAIVAEF